jgi:polyhydroxybutyrate depolymerase
MRHVAVLGMLMFAMACSGDDSSSVTRPITFGGARPVDLQVPSDFDPAKTYPLLIILHGYSVNAYLQQGYFQMNGAATEYQMLVMAPEGTIDSRGNQFWNADPTCCDLDATGVDDVAYLGSLVDDVSAAWPVKPGAVSLLGHSNGAFMAYRMACERPDVISAIVGLAGHATTVACTPSRAVNVLHLHGTGDAVVPYASGTFMGVTSPGAIDSVAAWATRNGCTGTAMDSGTKDLDSTQVGAESTVASTSGCPASGAAELWTIPGASHTPALTATFPADIVAWMTSHER